MSDPQPAVGQAAIDPPIALPAGDAEVRVTERCAKRLCGCWGIPVYLHISFPVIVVLDIANAFRYPSPVLFLIMFILLDIVSFVSILINVLGQSLATKLVGGRISHIMLWPLGVVASGSHNGDAKQDALVALAGSLTHIPQALVYGFILASTVGFDYLMYYVLPLDEHFSANFLRGCFRIQVLLFVFNTMIPVWPLNGGRLFASMLIHCFDMSQTAMIMICISVPLAIALGIWGVVEGLTLTAFLALWMLWQSFQLFRARKNGTLRDHPVFIRDREEEPPQYPGGVGPV